MSIGPVIGGFLILLDYSFLFYVNSFASLAAGIYLALTPLKSVKHPKASTDRFSSRQNLNSSVLADKKFLFFLFAIIPVQLVFFQHIGGLPLYIVDDLKYTTAAFGLLSAINTVLIILFEVPLNEIMSKLNYKHSIIIGSILAAVGFGAMAAARDLFLIIITIIIWTFGEMIFFPVSAAYVSEASPNHKRGEYMGYFQMTFSFALSAGPWLGTVVYEKFGSMVLWLGAFAMGLITSLLVLFTNEKQKSTQL